MILVDFLKTLVEMAEHAPRDAVIKINNDSIHELSLQLLSPIKVRRINGYCAQSVDKSRPKEFHILINGTEAICPPTREEY